MRPGERVRHAVLGEGEVVRLFDGGRMALVRFDGRPTLPNMVPVRRLEPLDGAPEPPSAPEPPAAPASPAPRPPAPEPLAAPASSAPRPPDPEPEPPSAPWLRRAVDARERAILDARQALEALRLGVVPGRELHAITVDRHVEIARLDELFELGRGMLVVSGQYGTGKTHLVEMAEAKALERGFLVARTTFDPVEVPPSHPLRVYAAVIRGLVYPGGGAGLRPLLDRLGPSAEHLGGSRWHRWLSPALFAHHHAPADLEQAVVEFVEGRGREDHRGLHRRLANLGYGGGPMYALPDYRTFGQVMAYLLGGIAAWARDAGWRGLAVLLDEAEYLDRLERTSREMAENVLRYLAMACLPDADLAFDPGRVRRGGQRVHRAVPHRFDDDQPLSVVCAFTPNPEVEGVLRELFARPGHRLDLEPIGGDQYALLADKVHDLAARAWPGFSALPAHRRRLARALQDGWDEGVVQTTRQAARMVVEFWDLYRADRARALAALDGA